MSFFREEDAGGVIRGRGLQSFGGNELGFSLMLILGKTEYDVFRNREDWGVPRTMSTMLVLETIMRSRRWNAREDGGIENPGIL